MNRKAIPIFKDPKTDSGHFKKSQRGCCRVERNANGEMSYVDGLRFDETENDPKNLLQPVFKDSKMVKEQSLAEIRNLLHDNRF